MVDQAQAVAFELPFILEMSGLIVGTTLGALTACELKLDVVGGMALGLVCGMGGGLIRDVIMQCGSVYMIDSPYAIPVSIAVALFVFFFHGSVARRPDIIEWLDVLAMAIFAAAGCDKALINGLFPAACILMGVLTGNGGGLLRDIVLGDVPKAFQQGNWYVICSLFGSATYWVCAAPLGIEKGLAAALAALVTVVSRRLSLRYNLQSVVDVDLTPHVKHHIDKARQAAEDYEDWHKHKSGKAK